MVFQRHATRKYCAVFLFVFTFLQFGGASPAFSADMQWWEGKNRVQVFSELLKEINAYSTYQCKMKIESYDDGLREASQILWYTQPGHMKIKQLGPFKKGATVKIESGGRITARLGGLLGILPVNVGPDSSLIKGITGDSAVLSSYQAIINKSIEREPGVKEFTINPAPDKNEIVVVYKMAEPISEYRFTIDTDRRIIVALERFRGDKLSSKIVWSDVRFGKDVDESEY